MATRRPNAVVTRASEIPPATAPIPEVFCVAVCWKAFKIPTTVPNNPIKGAVEYHSEVPDRHDEEQDDDATRQPAHICPQTHDAETDLGLLEVHREGSGNVSETCCKMSENHWNISSWFEL